MWYDPAQTAIIACSRGPKGEVGTPGGNDARVVILQRSQKSECNRNSLTFAITLGISTT
jgi:hypothetical protein